MKRIHVPRAVVALGTSYQRAYRALVRDEPGFARQVASVLKADRDCAAAARVERVAMVHLERARKRALECEAAFKAARRASEEAMALLRKFNDRVEARLDAVAREEAGWELGGDGLLHPPK